MIDTTEQSSTVFVIDMTSHQLINNHPCRLLDACRGNALVCTLRSREKDSVALSALALVVVTPRRLETVLEQLSMEVMPRFFSFRLVVSL
jgi:hypothetical protein